MQTEQLRQLYETDFEGFLIAAEALCQRWLYEHQIPFTLHFTIARDLKPLAQIRAFWHILRANREFKAYPQIRLGPSGTT